MGRADAESGAAYELDNNYNESTKINEYSVRFFHKGNEDEVYVEVPKQRAYDVCEVVSMLIDAGFCDVKAVHEYSDEAVRGDSARVTFVAI